MNIFFGKVENDMDPQQLGRVQVRVYSVHSANPDVSKTENLPWSQVLLSSTDGQYSAHQIRIGDWVALSRIDQNLQTFLVLGKTTSRLSELDGFGIQLPNQLNRNVVPKSATSEFKKSSAYTLKKSTVTKQVQVAKAPNLSTVDPDSQTPVRNSWDFPDPEDTTLPNYPLNFSQKTISGHVLEIDDSPAHERVLMLHRTGTHFEFLADGSKTLAVSGNNYTAVFGDDHILVRGSANITVEGNLNTLVKGDHVVEVLGNSIENIHGSKKIKVGGNLLQEVIQDCSTNIGNNQNLLVGQNKTETVGINYDFTVGGTSSEVHKTLQVLSTGNLKVASGENMDIQTPGGVFFNSPNMTFSTNYNGQDGQIWSMNQLDSRATGNFVVYGDVISNIQGDLVSLNDHTHYDPQTGPGETLSPTPYLSLYEVDPSAGSDFNFFDRQTSIQDELFEQRNTFFEESQQ